MSFRTLLIRLCLLAGSPMVMQATRIVPYYLNSSIYNGQNVPGYAVGSGYATTPSYWDSFAEAGKLDGFLYAFAVFNCNTQNGWQSNGYYPTNTWNIYFTDPSDQTLLVPQAFNLRTLDPTHHLKVVLSIGGYNFCTSNRSSPPDGYAQYGYYTYPFFSLMVNDEGIPSGDYSSPADRYATQARPHQGTRAIFVNSCKAYCGGGVSLFDGIDIDWEYPGQLTHGGATTDYQGLLTTFTALRVALPSNSGKIVSMASPATTAAWGAVNQASFSTTPWIAGTYSDGSTTYPGYEDLLAYNPDFFTPQLGEPYADSYEKTYFYWLAICGFELDWFNVECYDYFGPDFPAIINGIPVDSELAPLYSSNSGGYNQQGFSSNRTLNNYLSALIPSNIPTTSNPAVTAPTGTITIPLEKINMGIPAYGRSFQNASPGVAAPGTSFVGGTDTPAQAYSASPGYFNYYEVFNGLSGCWNFTDVIYNYDSRTSYGLTPANGYFGSFDFAAETFNGQPVINSVATKARYIQERGLGGAMLWSADCDDVLNGYPVLQSIIDVLKP